MKTIVVTCAIQIKKDNFSYLEKSKVLIDGYLKFTDFDILILTNNIDFYEELKNDRLIVLDYNKNYKLPIKSSDHFNMHIKRLPIEYASNLDYDIIYHHDCDCFIDGWDEESYQKTINKDCDVIFNRHTKPQIGILRRSMAHVYDKKIKNEFGDLYYKELDQSPNPTETRIIFKNNKKLKIFLEFWKKISDRNNDFLTYYCGLYFGTSTKHADMDMCAITYKDEFTKYGKIHHQGRVLNYFGDTIKGKNKK
jgi:hypothetical protein